MPLSAAVRTLLTSSGLFSYAFVVGDETEKREFENILQVGDGSEAVLLHEQIIRHAQHSRVNRPGLERESAIRHFAQIDHFHVFGIDLVVFENLEKLPMDGAARLADGDAVAAQSAGATDLTLSDKNVMGAHREDHDHFGGEAVGNRGHR